MWYGHGRTGRTGAYGPGFYVFSPFSAYFSPITL